VSSDPVDHAQQRPEGGKSGNATVIKKYANRRLYNTATSTYVTLEDLAQMVRGGTDFVVYDAKTGEDITRPVLTQIIFEEENKGSHNLLPINFLRQLIRFYGDAMQGVVPGYLEISLDTLAKDQDKIRKQMSDAFSTGTSGVPFGGDAMKTIHDITQRNMALFQDAMKTFNPFATMGMGGMAAPPTGSQEASSAPASQAKEPHAQPGYQAGTHASAQASRDELQQMRDQMAAMQAKLNEISKA
jgi:polyhydroxyalkanoate synthesis repressor PhaR